MQLCLWDSHSFPLVYSAHGNSQHSSLGQSNRLFRASPLLWGVHVSCLHTFGQGQVAWWPPRPLNSWPSSQESKLTPPVPTCDCTEVKATCLGNIHAEKLKSHVLLPGNECCKAPVRWQLSPTAAATHNTPKPGAGGGSLESKASFLLPNSLNGINASARALMPTDITAAITHLLEEYLKLACWWRTRSINQQLCYGHSKPMQLWGSPALRCLGTTSQFTCPVNRAAAQPCSMRSQIQPCNQPAHPCCTSCCRWGLLKHIGRCNKLSSAAVYPLQPKARK